jgi:hypothetical protein
LTTIKLKPQHACIGKYQFVRRWAGLPPQNWMKLPCSIMDAITDAVLLAQLECASLTTAPAKRLGLGGPRESRPGENRPHNRAVYYELWKSELTRKISHVLAYILDGKFGK